MNHTTASASAWDSVVPPWSGKANFEAYGCQSASAPSVYQGTLEVRRAAAPSFRVAAWLRAPSCPIPPPLSGLTVSPLRPPLPAQILADPKFWVAAVASGIIGTLIYAVFGYFIHARFGRKVRALAG
jgi:hypothetical protein